MRAAGGVKRGGMIALALVVVAAVAWAVLWFTPVATVKEIRVEGVVNGDAAAISESTGIVVGEKLARVDTDAAARAVAADPWVEKVTVGRSWPSAVTVAVQEHAAVIHMRATDGEHLFNGEGVEFLVAPAPPGSVEVVRVPRVENPEPGKLDLDPVIVRAVLDVLAALPERVRGEVARVDAPGQADIALILHDGREIYFGSSDRTREKGRAAEIVIDREGQRWNVSNPAEPTLRN